MKAGRNTPATVLNYIDAVWAKHAPPEPLELARELGISPNRYRILKERHGKRLGVHLRKEKRRRTERLRFVAKQNGLLHPPQYVSSVEGAIDEAESVPVEYDNLITMDAHRKWAERQEVERGEELARSQIRSISEALRQMAVQAARSGMDINPLLARLSREIENERRRAA